MNAIDLVKGFEGCTLEAYWDQLGQCWTIGWGHTGKDVYEGLVWTQEQADEARDHDLAQAAHLLALYSPGLAGGTLEALTDFVFNIGIGAYRSSTLRQYVNIGNLSAARAEIVKWDHSNGAVVPGLYRRRQAEAEIMGT